MHGHTQEKRPSPDEVAERLRLAGSWLADATHILVGAGAGMSIEAGVDYNSEKLFAERFPGVYRRGLGRCNYELMGYQDWPSETLKWGYMASHVNICRFQLPPHPSYGDLRALIGDRKYFVLTSNADGMFSRNGFDTDKIYTCQGDFQHLQCAKPCNDQVWPSRPAIDKMMANFDFQNTELKDASTIPTCPVCGGPATFNVRGGDYFREEHLKPAGQAFQKFVEEAAAPENKLLIIEIGAGFNTPSVIRWRLERLSYQIGVGSGLPVNFVRVNLSHYQIPGEIRKLSAALPLPTGEAMRLLKEVAQERTAKNR